MKKLFRNSFFSFLRNKTVVILLSLIIFLTTAAFTTFDSSSRAFEKSYNNVVSEGNLHDFTIKEKYDPEGSAISEPQATTDITFNHKVIIDKSSINYVDGNGNDFISFNQKAYKSGGFFSTTYTTPFLVKAKELNTYLTDTSASKTLDVDMIYKMDGSNMYRINDRLFNTDKGVRAALTDLASNPTKMASNGFTRERITLDAANPFTKKFNGHEMKTDVVWINEFEKTATKVMGKTYNVADGDYTKYIISLDHIKSGKMYSTYDQQIPSNERDEFYVPKSELTDPNIAATNSAGVQVVDWDKVHALDTKTFAAFNIDEHTKALIKKINNGVETAQHKMTLDYLNSFKNQGQLDYKDVKALYITGKDSSYKFVDNGTSTSPVDKLKIFSGWGLAKEEPWDQQVNKLKTLITKYNGVKTASIKDSDISKDGFRALWQDNSGLVPKNQAYIDLSSYSAVVSPSYAEANGKKALSRDEWNNLIKQIQGIFDKNIASASASDAQDVKDLLAKYKKNTVWIESTPYLVTGIGISPDFSYPIVDASSPIPNANSQAIIYTNSSGYARINQAFAGNPTENYIAVKASDDAPKNMFDIINDHLTKAMSWPSNMQAARKVNDLNEKYLLAPQRITFLQKIRRTVSTISWTTTILLIVFTAFIVALVIRKQISNRRKQLGILMANGYTRKEISLSMTSIGLIVASVSAILGYIVGHFMQFAFVGIFSNYWTLPIWQTQFSWITFLVTVIVPIIGVGLLAFVISYIELRGSLISILNGGASKTKSAVSTGIMRPFNWVGIKSKLTISIFASNISKMAMALAAFTATITVSAIAINSFGKFDTALAASENLSDYEYQVDLVSPTKESGKYERLSLNDMLGGDKVATKGAHIMYEHDGKNGMPSDSKSFFHVPTKNDSSGKTDEAMYLKNRLQMKSLLGPKMQAMGEGESPWVLARKMMPENQKNMADQKYDLFKKWSIDRARSMGDKNPYKNEKWFPQTGYKIDLESKDLIRTSGFLWTIKPHIVDSYIAFVEDSFKEIVKEYKTDRTVPVPYVISYGNIIADEDDETYTHVDTTVTYKNFKDSKVTEDWVIRGIEDNSDRINLSQKSVDALNIFNTPGVTPIVVNKFFAKVHSVNSGDIISSTITNMADENQLSATEKADQIGKFQIVGIEDSYDAGRTFTLQKYANHLLGWDLNSWDADNHMFNGIYSKHKDELMFNTLSLYSRSGFYEAVNKLNHTDDTNGITKTMKAAVSKWAPTGNPQVIGKDDDETLTKYVATYGAVPYVLSYSNVDWAMATNYQFHAVMKLSSSLIWLIEGIAFFIATLFVALISSMIISDNKKFISTLKVLGYRTREVSSVFLRTFIPALILAVIISGLLASAIVLGIQASLIGFGNVLIPFNIATWEIIAASAILVVGFLITYYLSSRELKNTSLLNAFKE